MSHLTLPNMRTEFKNAIHSSHLSALLNHQFPLDYLRKLYSTDIQIFYATRDEMILRGINLEGNTNSNFFPITNYINSPTIFAERKSSNYREIDFAILSLPNFIEKYKVDSDLFFNSIPVEGFVALAKNISCEFVIKVFENAGFQIIDRENVTLPEPKSEENKELIINIFPKPAFLAFHRYCDENGYKHFSDLNEEIINSFQYHPFVGEKKVKTVFERYNKHLEKISPPTFEASFNKFLLYFTNNDFRSLCKNIDLNYLNTLNNFYDKDFLINQDRVKDIPDLENIKEIVSKKIVETQKQNFNLLLSKLNKQPYTKYLLKIEVNSLKKMLDWKKIKTSWSDFDEEILIEDILPNYEYTNIINDLIEFQQTIISIPDQINQIKNHLNNRNFEYLILRNIHSWTLQAIAEKVGLTRERVRQIINKTEQTIIKHSDLASFKIFLHFLPKDELAFTKNYLETFYKVESGVDSVIFKYLLDHSDFFTFNEFLELYTSKRVSDHLNKKIDDLKNLPPILRKGDLTKYFDSMEDETIEFGELNEKINTVIAIKDYINPGELYFKKSISFKNKISYVFDHFVKEPMKMDTTGLQTFSDLFKRYFGPDIPPNERYIIERIRDTENTILVNPSTFAYFDPSAVDESFISHFKNFIEYKFLTKEWISINEVFSENQDISLKNNIKSKVHLYSLIQYFLSEDFEIGKGNTLNIYRSDTKKLRAEDSLESFLINFKNSVEKEKILLQFHWPQYKLDQLIGNSSKFISFDSNTVMLFSSLNMKSDDKNAFTRFLQNSLNSNYAFCYEIFQEMQFNKEYNLLLSKYEIKNHYALLQLFKKILPEVKGHSNFMYYESCQLDSVEKYIVEIFPSFTSRKDIYKHVLEKGYSEQMAQSVVREIMEKRLFIDYERNKIINRGALTLNNEKLSILKSYLEVEFKEKLYLSVIKLVGFKSHLPPLDMGDWTKHLIYHLGIEVGFRAIKSANDYRFDKLLLVRHDSPFHTYEQLIKSILENEYTGPLYENNVAKFLADSGLAHNDQKLSYELKSSPLFDIDTLGWISLKEES